MAERVEDLSIEYRKDGVELVRELQRTVLSKGAWATVMFLYQERKGSDTEFGPEKVSLRRFRKIQGQYRIQSKFTISSKEQARKVWESLRQWFDFE